MSLGDHIDEILEDKPDPVGEVATSAFTSITDSIIDTHSAVKVLAITATAEIGLFVMFYFAKDKVVEGLNDSEPNVWIYSAIAIFVIGFLTAFAGFRLVADRMPRLGRGITIWLVAGAAGVANILLFYVLLAFQLRS